MRTYEDTYESQRSNIIDVNCCDVFISTWDMAGNARHDDHDADGFKREVSAERIREIFGHRLKSLAVHNFKETCPKFPNVFYGGMVAMYWQIAQCDRLRRAYEREHGFKYDCIIRSRADLYFETGFKLEGPEALGPFVWVPHFDDCLIDDCFAFGGDSAMSAYAGVFDQLETYERYRDFYKTPPNYNCICWPEQTLLFHLNRNGVPLHSFPIRYTVYREAFSHK